MIESQNLSLRTLARPVSGLFHKLKSCADFLLSIPTLCPHRNRHNTSSFHQACWDCGRVRYNGGCGWSVWHRDGVQSKPKVTRNDIESLFPPGSFDGPDVDSVEVR